MLGGGNTLAAGREAEAALCRIQRHAQYGIGCARRRNAAPDPAHSGRRTRRLQRDESELRLLARDTFEGTEQVHLPDIFPPFLSDEVPKHHGVVACEGSMFKSKFANALTTMMIGSLGIAAVQNKLSVGYGAEAGHMDPLVAKMCGRYCKNSLVITRNEESRSILRELGVPTELGHRHRMDLRTAAGRVRAKHPAPGRLGRPHSRCLSSARSIPLSGR